MLMVFLATLHLVLKINDRLMMTQLKDVPQTLACLALGQSQVVEHGCSRDQGFLTDHVTTKAKASCDVWMMQVVGRADRDDIQGGRRIAFQPPGMVIESLELSEKIALRRKAVDNSDRIINVVCAGYLVASVLDGTHMARCYITGGTDKGKSFHTVSRERLRHIALGNLMPSTLCAKTIKL